MKNKPHIFWCPYAQKWLAERRSGGRWAYSYGATPEAAYKSLVNPKWPEPRPMVCWIRPREILAFDGTSS